MDNHLFKHLFSPITIGSHTIKNRIVLTGHDTCLPTDGTVNDALVAYHEKRAKNGVGLIVLQVSGVHESARYTPQLLMATDDSSISGYKKLVEKCTPHGTKIFAQLFHPGREILESADGLKPIAYSASSIPQERFHVMPRQLSKTKIKEIIDGFGTAAYRMKKAGIQGFEILVSHGYLPAQFITESTNTRTDEYGGSFENRLRFLSEVIDEVRSTTNNESVVGIRISSDEKEDNGLKIDECLKVLQALEHKLDYVSVVAGTSSTLGGAVHIVPPMVFDNAYLKEDGKLITEVLSIPVILTGRINQPHEAESVIASGAADMCGMTRAMICDPEMPRKAQAMDVDGIRACIGCNQACIGHFQKGIPISCIQYPESGRELQYATIPTIKSPKKVAVIGGGPAGMKAAISADKLGHQVTLFEASPQLGGQAKLAQLLPHRAEFGGVITNFQEELRRSKVNIRFNQKVDVLNLEEEFNHIVIATGATSYLPPYEEMGDLWVVHANELLSTNNLPSGHVVIYDAMCDWVGMGMAELLVSSGAQVTLAVNGLFAGQNLPSYVRDSNMARLHQLGVKVINYARFYGVDDDSAYFQYTSGGGHFVLENVSAVVCVTGSTPNVSAELEDQLAGKAVTLIGDCLATRTVEEAVYEGLKVAHDL